MEQEAQRRLSDLTRQFYAKHASSFSSTRQGAWSSWQSIIELVESQTEITSVLDIGCGNGRFADFLNAQINYVGIDAEPALLAAAKATTNRTFLEGDFDFACALNRRFDLVVLFGVMHHIPGSDARTSLLQKATKLLNDNGVLVVSFWQPRQLPNFENKVWTTPPPDISALLEENDYLLGWQNDFSAVRYCHHFDDEEIDEIVNKTGLNSIANFNGRENDATNKYALLVVG